MRTPQTIIRHELIGLPATVVQSSNTFQKGLTGFIVNETKNTISIQTTDSIKCLQKQYILLRVTLPDSVDVILDGSSLLVSPTRRIKMMV